MTKNELCQLCSNEDHQHECEWCNKKICESCVYCRTEDAGLFCEPCVMKNQDDWFAAKYESLIKKGGAE